MNLRGLTGREIAQQDVATRGRAAGVRAEDTANRAVIKAQQETAKEKRAIERVTFSRPYNSGGKSVRDRLVGGSVVGQEELGKADSKFKPTIIEMPDGNLQEISIGSPIPEGARLPTKTTRDLTAAQQISVEGTLAKFRSWLTSAEPKDLRNLEGYVDFYNKHSPDENVKIVYDEGFWGNNSKVEFSPKPIADKDVIEPQPLPGTLGPPEVNAAGFEALKVGDKYTVKGQLKADGTPIIFEKD